MLLVTEASRSPLFLWFSAQGIPPWFFTGCFHFQVVNMHFQGVGLCLGLLFITAKADFVDDGVEVEDFSESSDESDFKDEPSSGVRRLRSEL